VGNHEEDQAGNGMLDASGNVDVVNIRCSMSSVPTATNTHIRSVTVEVIRGGEVSLGGVNNRDSRAAAHHGLSGGKSTQSEIFG